MVTTLNESEQHKNAIDLAIMESTFVDVISYMTYMGKLNALIMMLFSNHKKYLKGDVVELMDN